MRKVGLIAALVLLGASVLASGAPFEPSPPMKSAALPTPPMQLAGWTAPKTDLPADLVSATARLFQQGLADPRGCEYRTISVGTGDCWSGDGGVVQCHGWVIPSKKADEARFAVCWNGLVYPVISVGAEADLDADVKALIKGDDEIGSQQAPDSPVANLRAGSEGESISETSISDLGECMLLRLSKDDLAAQLWRSRQGPARPGNHAASEDPYLSLSDELLWSSFDRAICAHMRGDDNLALVTARFLTTLRKSVDDEYAARKIKFDQPNQPRNQYLDVLPALLADQKRRAKEPTRTPALKLGEKAFTTKAAWVAALIKDLDQVSARQNGQPGGVDLGEDPIVQALIACGDDAVEPLLDCLEHDTRLTRSVHFWRDFAPERMPLSVDEAAYVALSGILQTSFFGAGSTGDDLTSHGQVGRKEVADKIRAYWKKYKGLPLAERWYRILADDQASPEQWEQAMGNIARPVDVDVTPGSMFGTGWVSVPNRKPGEVPKLMGENLRSKTKPSVLELADRRIEQVDKIGEGSSEVADSAANASEMAVECWEFDARGSLPILRKQLDFCVGLWNSDKFYQDYGEPMEPGIDKMAQVMAKAGDRSGLKTYGEWIRNVSPGNLGSEPADVLSDLWEFSDDPAIATATEWMFNNPASQWNPMLEKVVIGWRQDELLASPLLGIKSFRDQMRRGLKDASKYATVRVEKDGHVQIKYDGGNNSELIIPFGETHIAPKGTSMVIRTCDYYAQLISEVGGAPEIEFYWPQADRDAAVKACADFLNRFSGNLVNYDRYKLGDDQPFVPLDHLTFELLDHPASLAEAKAEKAIFSLEGQGERRLYKLPNLPVKATWTALKKYRFDQQFYNENTGESGYNHIYFQDCWVWQAEEVNVNGTWERYFGVVGPHEVAKVPASEIEFPGDYQWYSFDHGIDMKLDAPGDVPPGQDKAPPVKMGSPLIVHMILRNRRGVAQPMPAEFVEKRSDGTLAFRPGVSIVVERLGNVGDVQSYYPRPKGAKLPSKPVGLMGDDRAKRTKMVESTQTFSFGSFDLRDCCNFTRPGTYRATIYFAKNSGFTGGQSPDIEFDLIGTTVNHGR